MDESEQSLPQPFEHPVEIPPTELATEFENEDSQQQQPQQQESESIQKAKENELAYLENAFKDAIDNYSQTVTEDKINDAYSSRKTITPQLVL